MWIVKTILIFVLALCTRSYNYRQYRDHLKDYHQVSNQCCLSGGGKLCGTVVKSCCDSAGCQKTWYGGQGCKGLYLDPICHTCSDQCTQKPHGTVCGVSISNSKIQCCELENCERAKGGIADKLIDKAIDKSTSFAGSLLKNENDVKKDESKAEESEHHFAFADRLLDKLAGPSSKCKAGTVIQLPKNCIPDSLSSLLAARIF